MADNSMAVYHLKVSVGSRAGGQSACAKSDYIEREGRYAADGEEREHVAHGNMPAWAQDAPRTYWTAADDHERANGRVYREVQFALPRELTADQRREVSERFAAQLTGEERLPYTLALHRGGPEGENPHAHLMISERANDGLERRAAQWFKRHNPDSPAQGGAKKSRAAMPKAWLEETRQAWEQTANRALAQAGRAERIDGRSLADRRDAAHRAGDLERAAALSREPNVHLGPQGLKGVSGEAPSRSPRLAQADDVEQRNDKLAQDRAAADEQLAAKQAQISWLEREVQRIAQVIREVMERIAARSREPEQERPRGRGEDWGRSR